MGRKVISIGLSVKDIKRAIREIEQYKLEFQQKCDQLVEKIAERIASEAQHGFNGAIVDDLTELSGGPVKANVNVRTEKRGDIYVIVADGEDAVWVEFGAGVHHNGEAGKSPNPYSAQNQLGFTIGGFGTLGKRDLWGFLDENDELKLTHGTPAKMPMYNAVQAVAPDIASMAKEVFG